MMPTRSHQAAPAGRGASGWRRRVALVLTALALAAPSWFTRRAEAGSGTPVSYTTTWTDPRGTPRAVRFQGEVDSGTVTGTLTVGTVTMALRGVVGADGTVAGTVVPTEASRASGTFQGQRDAAAAKWTGSYRVGATTGSWMAPASAVPATSP
jgi:hypothetical protein